MNMCMHCTCYPIAMDLVHLLHLMHVPCLGPKVTWNAHMHAQVEHNTSAQLPGRQQCATLRSPLSFLLRCPLAGECCSDQSVPQSRQPCLDHSMHIARIDPPLYCRNPRQLLTMTLAPSVKVVQAATTIKKPLILLARARNASDAPAVQAGLALRQMPSTASLAMPAGTRKPEAVCHPGG